MISFHKAVLTCFKKYFIFKGRATRAEYWWFQLFGYLVYGADVGMLFLSDYNWDLFFSIAGIVYLVMLLPNLSVTFRRLHDAGHSGWCIFYNLIPYCGTFIFLFFLCVPSDANNKYGPNPRQSRFVQNIEEIEL